MTRCGRLLIGVFALSLLTVPARAQDDEQLLQRLSQCARQPDQLRLACFDAIVRNYGIAPPAAHRPAPHPGRWMVRESVNPMDDFRTVSAFLLASNSVRTRFQTVTPTLWIACRSRRTEVWVSWDTFVASRSARVTFRVGSSPPTTETWPVSTDFQATFSPEPIPLIRQLVRAETLLVQVTPYGENPIMASFDLAGVEHVVGRVQQACNWR